MKIIQTHKYYSKFRQHNGRVVKTGTVPSTAPRSTLKPRGFFDNGDHASSSHVGGIYIFISFPQTNPMWFQPNISQPQLGIFQPQSININHKQSQTTIRYQSIFTPITINKYRPWFVDEGRIYIYIYRYIFIDSNSLSFHIYIIFLNQKSHQ